MTAIDRNADLMTVAEFAKRVRHSTRSVRRWIACKRLRAVRVTGRGSGRFLIRRDELAKFLSDGGM
jgi:excisionase family DNA binding protein